MENEEEKMNQLKIENEIKKMKLSLEHGANFFSPPENKLPPEMEGLWLDHIQKFEDSFAHSKTILLYDFIEKPNYIPSNVVSDNEVTFELNRLMDLLGEKGICVDTICEVADKELYRFITEELFLLEIDDMNIEGMMTHFTYEEFHPNHPYDIERNCTDFINSIIDKSRKLNFSYLPVSDEIYTADGMIKKEDAKNKIEVFRKAFTKFKLQKLDITSIQIIEDLAEASFDINYSGVIKGSKEVVNFNGSGSFKLVKDYEIWCIQKINMPGIPL